MHLNLHLIHKQNKFHATSRGTQRNSQSGLTQNEQSEAVEQGTDVGQDPHQHCKLGKDKHDKSEFGVYVSREVAACFLLCFRVKETEVNLPCKKPKDFTDDSAE